jgi:hypothetical protein
MVVHRTLPPAREVFLESEEADEMAADRDGHQLKKMARRILSAVCFSP